MIDITILLCGVVALVFAVIVYKLWPYLKANAPANAISTLSAIAGFFVWAVEAEIGRGNGSEKFDLAFKRMRAFLEKYGVTFDEQMIKDAIKQEWKKLDLEQIEVGEKDIWLEGKKSTPADAPEGDDGF